jgi:hypothetical protein
MTKYFCWTAQEDLVGEHPKTLAFGVVPAGQMWRPQYFVVERIAGSESITLESYMTPAADIMGHEHLINRFQFSGEDFRRVETTALWGPGDKVRVAAVSNGPVTLKMLVGIIIDEGITVYTAPAAGPVLTWIEPATVPRNSKPTFTLGGSGFTTIQSAIEVVIRRPNAVEQSRTGTFVNDGTITFSYDNITLAGVYNVKVKNATLTSNAVPFTAVEA